MNKIAEYLNQHTAGNIFDKLSIREAYATDASILREVPRFVAVPEDVQDIRKILRFSDRLAERNFRLPITVRRRSRQNWRRHRRWHADRHGQNERHRGN